MSIQHRYKSFDLGWPPMTLKRPSPLLSCDPSCTPHQVRLSCDIRPRETWRTDRQTHRHCVIENACAMGILNHSHEIQNWDTLAWIIVFSLQHRRYIIQPRAAFERPPANLAAIERLCRLTAHWPIASKCHECEWHRKRDGVDSLHK